RPADRAARRVGCRERLGGDGFRRLPDRELLARHAPRQLHGMVPRRDDPSRARNREARPRLAVAGVVVIVVVVIAIAMAMDIEPDVGVDAPITVLGDEANHTGTGPIGAGTGVLRNSSTVDARESAITRHAAPSAEIHGAASDGTSSHICLVYLIGLIRLLVRFIGLAPRIANQRFERPH